MEQERDKERPGVSGKKQKGKSWINPDELNKQKKFIDEIEHSKIHFIREGTGRNLYGRTGNAGQHEQRSLSLNEEQVLAALRLSPEVDVQEIQVRVEGCVVYLYGLANNVNELRMMENIAMNVPGVSEVISLANLKSGEKEERRDLR